MDEFGHIGPYISRTDPQHRTSPVFGLGGIALPSHRVREFATWFYKLKCNLLAFEIQQSRTHPARWEKKGAALLTTKNITKYRQLRLAINRILDEIESVGGFVFYQGMAKHHAPSESSSEQLYAAVLRSSIQKLNAQCVQDNAQFMMILDESEAKFHRDVIIKKAALTMFGDDYCTRLVEPPFQVASHLFQTLQCADWICGLLGRLGAYNAEPVEFEEFKWARTYFGDRLARVAKRSGIRSKQRALEIRAYVTRINKPTALVASTRLIKNVVKDDGTTSCLTVDVTTTVSAAPPPRPPRRRVPRSRLLKNASVGAAPPNPQ